MMRSPARQRAACTTVATRHSVASAPPEGQRAPPEGQRAPPEGQRAPPAGQRAPPAGQRAPNAGQRSQAAGQRVPSAFDDQNTSETCCFQSLRALARRRCFHPYFRPLHATTARSLIASIPVSSEHSFKLPLNLRPNVGAPNLTDDLHATFRHYIPPRQFSIYFRAHRS